MMGTLNTSRFTVTDRDSIFVRARLEIFSCFKSRRRVGTRYKYAPRSRLCWTSHRIGLSSSRAISRDRKPMPLSGSFHFPPGLHIGTATLAPMRQRGHQTEELSPMQQAANCTWLRRTAPTFVRLSPSEAGRFSFAG